MATATVNLSVPAPADDSMEMSSPARHGLDEDIDFDDWQPDDSAQHANDNDRMIEDGEQTRPATATDDVMEDDMLQGDQTIVQEEVMQDSPSHVQQLEDEELIDYSDDELPDEVVEDAGAPEMIEQSSVAAPPGLQDGGIDEQIIRHPDDAVFEQAAKDAEEAFTSADEAVAPLPSPEDTKVTQETAGADDVAAEEVDQLEQATLEPHGQGVEEYIGAGLEEPPATDDAEPHRPVVSLDTSAQTFVDGPATPTDTGLHAMTVRFGDFQSPLFKSRNQPDGLLKNDNLASLSLGELIQNCRQRLAIKTGETLSENQDLVLGFDQLGLILVEDSRAAFECSLEEVLDIYLQLHRNDDTQDIPPFSLNLSLQLKFTSSISVLKQAAAGGSGMSSFGFDHSGEAQHTGEYEEYPEAHVEDDQEGLDEQHQPEETADGHEYEQAAPVEGSIPEQQEADTNFHYGGFEEQPTEYSGQEEYYQGNEEQYDEGLDQGQYYPEDEDEATYTHDAYALQGEGYVEESADAVYNAPGDQAAAVEESARATLETAAAEEKTASTATSMTLQGDDGQDTTGEYIGEDLIDWDDDSDLTSDPSDQTSTSKTDYSTFLTETEDEGNGNVAKPNAHQRDGLEQDFTHASGDTDNEDTADTGHFDTDAQNLGSEDNLGELEEYQLGEDHVEDDEKFDAAPEDGHEAYGQEYDQTDENAAQQDDFNSPKYQPGEDGERSQTAYELFDGPDVEQHGPEQDIPGHNADQALATPATNGEQANLGVDDFIDFDLDDEPPPDRMVQKPEAAAAGSRTPLAKRSYEDLAGSDEIDFDSPEPKKARAS